ncbi:MAG: FAD:protein FMN transferase [Acidobacteria bacterium]|nr:MAG: FAD:protein FMN transferase [Acidobacteriota bacterium]
MWASYSDSVSAANETTVTDMNLKCARVICSAAKMIDVWRNIVRFIGATCLLVTVVSAVGCSNTSGSSGPQLVERSHASMGSELRLTAWTADQAGAAAAFEAIFREFDRLEGLLSTWRDGSDIQRLNAAAGKHPVPVGTELREILRTARQVSDWTGGKFDVTFGVMSGIWKFDYQNQDGTIPDHNEVVRRRSFIDYRELEVDERAGTAFLRREGMVANLGGIGKGYAVDHARVMLRERGVRDFMIQFGGDMYAAGRRGDRPWRLGIQDPRGPANRIFAAMDVSDSTFSTSGDYERFFVKDGRRYHHILDPATGEPAVGCRSVTIMTSSATVADGLSTGVFILGPEAGMTLIERLPGVEGVIVGANNEVLVSSGLQGHLMLLASPTDAP